MQEFCFVYSDLIPATGQLVSPAITPMMTPMPSPGATPAVRSPVISPTQKADNANSTDSSSSDLANVDQNVDQGPTIPMTPSPENHPGRVKSIFTVYSRMDFGIWPAWAVELAAPVGIIETHQSIARVMAEVRKRDDNR
jgi:hypothetical protein